MGQALWFLVEAMMTFSGVIMALFAIPKMLKHPELAALKRRAGLFAIPKMQEHPGLVSLKRRAGLCQILMSQTHRDVV